MYTFIRSQSLCRLLHLSSRFGQSRTKHTLPGEIPKHDSSVSSTVQSNDILYPHFDLDPIISPSKFWKDYSGNRFQPSEKDSSLHVHVAGRIASRRDSSANLIFLSLFPDTNNQVLQIVLSKNRMQTQANAWETLRKNARIGSHHYFTGFPGKTDTGHLSLFAREAKMLTPASKLLPLKCDLKHTANLVRPLELLLNPNLRQTLKVRSMLMQSLRTVLDQYAFIEVETPILGYTACGASARPFVTESVARSSLYLRIAPELFLKQMIISGFSRVYEIGKVFRKETLDATHHPEFTMCEAYAAYSNLSQGITFLETMLAKVVGTVQPSLKVQKKNGDILDFSPPYPVLSVVDFLENHLGPLPDLSLDSAALQKELVLYYQKNLIPLPQSPHTPARLFEKLITTYIEPKCDQPTYLSDFPAFLSPLAKRQKNRPSLCSRIELFVDGSELINGYEELNDPMEQKKRFLLQLKEKAEGDSEIPEIDEQYCQALEYGLPPTFGWGMGIDRLCMLLTQTHHIRNVIAFPMSGQRPSRNKKESTVSDLEMGE